jgi:hypothetical protein
MPLIGAFMLAYRPLLKLDPANLFLMDFDQTPDFTLSAGDLENLLPKPAQLQDYLIDEAAYSGFSEVCYDLRVIMGDDELTRLLIEFIEQYPDWSRREVHFRSQRHNIPLVDEASVIIHLPDCTIAEIIVPLYQHQVKANSEDVWRIFKAVMKGENTPLSWRRHLEDFEELHPTNTYHVRRLESAEVKRQVLKDFVVRYHAIGIKTIPVKLKNKIYPWYMLTSKREGISVRLCIVVDNDTTEQNHAQFFELVRLFKEHQTELSTSYLTSL